MVKTKTRAHELEMKEGRKACEEIYAEKKAAAIEKEAGSQAESHSQREPDSEEE